MKSSKKELLFNNNCCKWDIIPIIDGVLKKLI